MQADLEGLPMKDAERGDLEKSLIALEAENQQLRERIGQYEKSFVDQIKATILDQLSQLREGSDKIADQIKVYTPIAEDVWGLRVFEKAKSYLVGWITFGGITALIVGGLLFAGAYKYAVDLIDTKVKSLTDKEIWEIVKNETKPQVVKLLTDKEVWETVKNEMKQQVETDFKEHHEEYSTLVLGVYGEQLHQLAATVQSSRGYGGLPMAATIAEASAIVPSASVVDYTPQMGEVRSQGEEGSVVGFAIAYAMEYQIFKTTHQRVRLSPRAIYYLSRKLTNSFPYDSGAQIKDGVKAVLTKGAVLDNIWPYKERDSSASPPRDFATATRYKLKRAVPLKGIDQIKSALSTTGPVVAGITLYDSMVQEDVKKTGLVPMPKAKESVIGGHAICIVGYDDSKKLFKFINSWSDEWGDKGYGYLSYQYMKNNSDDIWSLSM